MADLRYQHGFTTERPEANPQKSGGFKTGVWSPILLPCLVGWWDISNPATIPAQPNNTVINGLPLVDLSAIGHDLASGGAGNILYKTSGINGLPAMDASGSTSAHYLLNWPELYAQPVTIFFVGRTSVPVSIAHSTPLGGPSFYKAGAGVWALINTAFAPSTIPSDASTHAFASVFNGVGSTLRVDGTTQAVGSPGVIGPLDGFILGAYFANSIPWLGQIGEAIVCSCELSPPDMALVMDYLKTKWGTP